MLNPDTIEKSNRDAASNHEREFGFLADQLDRRGISVEPIIEKLRAFEVAIPSWALGTGGTRFGRFPGTGEPRNVFEKMEDIAVVRQLTVSASSVSLHIPWDEPDDAAELRDHAQSLGLKFDAVNSNTFQDQTGQKLSYKFGSLSHTDASVRQHAIEHNIHVIDVGKALGSKATSIWLADGSNYPGQMHLRKSFNRVLDGLKVVYQSLPEDWTLFTEHKPYEPAFYATVVQDWGSSFILASALGDRAMCLVDLGHHLPNTNVELVVARLIGAGKLGGFHFNDSMYGDDDLTTGSIRPYRLFLIFNELVDAANEIGESFRPAYMLDQSHNLKDPIEALIQSVLSLQRAYAQALIIERDALSYYQEKNDVLMAEETLKVAYQTDVSALIAEARLREGSAIKPMSTFRTSAYRMRKSKERSAGVYAPPQSL